jgi:ACT domain-containing protein
MQSDNSHLFYARIEAGGAALVLDREPNPKETIQIIDLLVKRKLISEDEFKSMHHMGASMSSFKKYCSKITKFRRNGKNWDLHESLQKNLDSHR